MYTQFNNSHISDDIKNIPVDKLKIGEHIILLNGSEDILLTNNYKLMEIRHDKIYIFDNVNGKNSINCSSDFNLYSNNYDSNKLYMYPCNNSLIYLFETNNYLNNYRCNDDFLDQIGDSIYNDCKNKNITSNSVNIVNTKNDEVGNKYFNYLIIPLNNKAFMCLLKEFTYKTDNSEYTYVDDYILFGEYPDEIKEVINKISNKHEIDYFNNRLNQYRGNITQIFEEIKNNLNYDITQFEETLFALNYDLNYYLRDLDRKSNIEKVQNIFNKLNIKIDIKNKYIPCFEHKSGIKAYHFNNDIFVTINDQLISRNNGYYNGEVLYTQNGLKVAIEIPDKIKNNKKNQILFKAASKIAEFEKNKNGINPQTGDFYEKGKIDNERVIYKDFNSLIINEKSYNKSYYIKQYGFFIQSFDKNKNNEIKERYQVISKLIE